MNLDLLRRTRAFIASESIEFDMASWFREDLDAEASRYGEEVLENMSGDWCGTAACIGGAALIVAHDGDPDAILAECRIHGGPEGAAVHALDFNDAQRSVFGTTFWPKWARRTGDDRAAALALLDYMIEHPESNLPINLFPEPTREDDAR